MDIARQFGRNLFLCRRRAGLSQEKLAIRASLHRTEIGLLENAERLPRIDTLVKLTCVLEVRSDELLKGIVWEPGERAAGKFVITGPLSPWTKR